MTITALEKQKKHLVKIFFDNGEECLLDKDVCIDAALASGLELDEEKLDGLKYESDYRRAKSRALWYLDRGDYTEKSMYLKLLRAGFEKRACAAAIARLTEYGIIDDRRFAERFCERLIESNISKCEALHKMLEKGVPYDMAKETLDSADADEDAQLAALIEKKYESKLSQPHGIEKVYAALVRKGFSYSAVRNALKKYSEELEYSEEYDV